MVRTKTESIKTDFIDSAIKNAEIAEETRVSIEDMPLETMRDYRLYNEAARIENKKLKKCRYQCKQCPIELHPTERIIFARNDQPENPLPVYISDEKIHFKKTLIPGNQYDLPKYVVHHLQERGKAIFKWVENADGSSETKQTGKDYRFSLKTVYSNDYE